MRSARIGLAVASIAFLLPAVGAENWPRFRGPNGDGISADKGVPVQWTERDGVAWKVALPGIGHSSPVIWGDRLFVQSADEKHRMLLCLRVADGKPLWTHVEAGAKGKTHQKNSLASSTPATDGKRVYAIFWDGRDIALHALSIDGKPLWKRGLGEYVSQHGPGMSPMLFEDLVIVANDQDGSAALLAFNALDGKPAWQVERPYFRACYSTPFLLERPGKPTELIVGSTAGLTSYDPRTGKEYWNWTWKFDAMALRTVASPVYGQDIILINSGDGSGLRHTVAVKLFGSGKETKPSLAWQYKRDFPYVPCLLIQDEFAYSVTDSGTAGCYELKTGKEVWRERLDCTVTASPVLIDGKIYSISDQGEVLVFEAAPTFKLLGKSAIGEPVSATPAVADNRLFVRGDKHLFCIGGRAK